MYNEAEGGEEMPVSEAQRRASAKHDKDNFEYCTVKVRKGKKSELQAHVAKQGESLNAFVARAIDAAMEADNNLKE